VAPLQSERIFYLSTLLILYNFRISNLGLDDQGPPMLGETQERERLQRASRVRRLQTTAVGGSATRLPQVLDFSGFKSVQSVLDSRQDSVSR
jgi:hypothetical protein